MTSTVRRALLLALLLTGCSAVKPGVKTAAFDPKPRKVFVWSFLQSNQTGARFEPGLTQGFLERFAADLTACGAEVTVYGESGLELDDSALKKAIESSGADTLVTIRKRKGQLDQAGRLDWAYYDLEFLASGDPAAPVFKAWAAGKKPVSGWKGEFLLSIRYPWTGFKGEPFEPQGARQASKVVNQLKAEGFFPGCAPVKVAEPGAGQAE